MKNAWQLYRLTPKGKKDNVDLLAFTGGVVQKYFMTYSEAILRPDRSPLPGKQRVPDDVCLDGRNHVVVRSETQIRNAVCHKNTLRKCKKCNVGCHVSCFVKFHS